MNSQSPAIEDASKTGLWLVGARGAVSSTLALGLAALKAGETAPTGILTETPAFAHLPWVPWSALTLGGHDVCTRTVEESVQELVRAHIAPADFAARFGPDLADFEEEIAPGLIDGGEAKPGWHGTSVERSALSPLEQVQAIQSDWTAFEARHGLVNTVIVYLASTEAAPVEQAAWQDLEALREALLAGVPQPASLLYAFAALDTGRPFVNFTPNLGASVPALEQLARERGVPHCGKDGKTGETLLKTSLAPMFHARALKVLSWQGYNMLGNRDGDSLRTEGRREAKLANKDEALRSILSPEDSPKAGDAPNDLHSHVAIDYVPSLGDWKTAWDFVHFEGFLGARMSLQFTWAASDSALAAPLVLDLVRLTDLARRRGETGALPQTASFFKAPLTGGTHDFHQQFQSLLEYLGQVSS